MTQLLRVQFYTVSFETVQLFLSWSEDVYVIWIKSSDFFFFFFFYHFFFLFSQIPSTCKDCRYLIDLIMF